MNRCGGSPVTRLLAVALAVAATMMPTATVRAQDGDAPAALLAARGCLACHSLDGSSRFGPTFASAAERPHPIVSHATFREVVFDAAYVRRAILEPDAELVVGYAAGSMPLLARDLAEARELTDAVIAVASRPPPSAPVARSAAWLVFAALAFVLCHLLGSAAPVRSRLVAQLGERGFQGVYSLVVLVASAWMVLEWSWAPYVELFRPPGFTRWVPNVIMPIAYVLLVAGYTAKSPTVAGMASEAGTGPVGFARITRHPALWGFALWGLSHLAANGDLRSFCLMGGVATLALAGMLHIDARRRATGGAAGAVYERSTSVLPFAAIARGQPWPTLRELGWWRIALGLGAWGAMLLLHGWLIGVSPLP